MTVREIADGDSQLKLMDRHRASFRPTAELLRLSFSSSTTETLPRLLVGLRLQQIDFIAIYVSGHHQLGLGPDNSPAAISGHQRQDTKLFVKNDLNTGQSALRKGQCIFKIGQKLFSLPKEDTKRKLYTVSLFVNKHWCAERLAPEDFRCGTSGNTF